MKFEKISDKKLRITCTEKELKIKNIDPGKLTSDPDEAQDLILDIIESLEDKFDFDISGARFMIEATSTPNDTFVVVLTNMEDDEKNHGETQQGKKFLKLKQKMEGLLKCEEKNVIIRFDSLENTIAFADATLDRFQFKSELYKVNGEYYLNIKPSGKQLLDKTSILRISSDFGHYMENACVCEGYLKEHASLIIPHKAVQKLVSEF